MVSSAREPVAPRARTGLGSDRGRGRLHHSSSRQAIPVVLAGRDVGWVAPSPTPARPRSESRCRSCTSCSPGQPRATSPARPPCPRADPRRRRASWRSRSRKRSRTIRQDLPGIRSTCVFGGVDIRQQLPIVRAGVEILVATPGRLLDHFSRPYAKLQHLEIFVLDEADRMLDMGFIPDIKRIIALLPARRRQNLLFSATFSGEIKKLADSLLNQPQLIEVARRNSPRPRPSSRAVVQGPAGQQAPAARAHRPFARPETGALLRAHEAWRVAPRPPAREGRPGHLGHPRRQDPGRASRRARRVQGREARGTRRDRRGRARPRHRRPAARRELRAAARSRGLHPSDRPHRRARAPRAKRSRSSTRSR